MIFTFFGLSVTSAWGNGHATLLRGLFRALHEQGHYINFFEKDTSYYSAHRDAPTLPFANVYLYSQWDDIVGFATQTLRDSDVGVVTSYCHDGQEASSLILESGMWRKVFYDMDTPVTLSRLDRGESVSYLPKDGLQGFDLVLSYTGGLALDQLRERLQAKRTAALYGWVDSTTHFPVPPDPKFTSDFSYLGTFATDRHKALQELLLTPAARLPQHRFLIGGAMYRDAGTWPGNVRFLDHVAPPEHRPFYCSSPATLNVTRQSMAAMGYCPSGRLFEAAACGTAVLSDWWEGLDTFFKPNEEILVARSSDDAVRAITGDQECIRQIGQRAMERALDCHTAEARARRLVSLLEDLPNESAFEVTAAVLASRNV